MAEDLNPAPILQLARGFMEAARLRIAGHFAALAHNNDRGNYKLAQSLLEGKHRYLRRGIVE